MIDLQRADLVGHEVVQTTKALTSLRHHFPRPAEGVEHSAYPLMSALMDQPLRVSAVADQVGSDVSTVSRQITGLMTSGLVEKILDPDDGRAQLVALSAAGRECMVQMRRNRAVLFQRLLRDWSEQDLDDLSRLLNRLREAIITERAQLPTTTKETA